MAKITANLCQPSFEHYDRCKVTRHNTLDTLPDFAQQENAKIEIFQGNGCVPFGDAGIRPVSLANLRDRN